jgi:hypothetical protein
MALRHLVPSQVQPAVRAGYTRFGTLTPGLRMQPSFLVIGGQRCGTTSLFKALEQHPQLLRPGVEKGIDYFTLHYGEGLDWYRGHFPLERLARLRRGRHGTSQAFEACTYYAFHPYAIERIAHDFPDIKLVFMLRDPVERAYSAYKHEVARGFETAATFDEALALEDARLEGEDEKMRTDLTYESHANRHQAYRHRGDYATQVERALQHFPREQLHVLDSEAFFESPERVYGELMAFLGLNHVMPSSFDRYNARPGSDLSPDARAYLSDFYAGRTEALSDLLGRRPHWVQSTR